MTPSSTSEPANNQFWLTPRSRNRLLTISLGWVLVAALEASAYITLAWSIAVRQSVGVVVISAAAALIATVLVTRLGYICGARLAGDLYTALGDALAQARLSWFSGAHRAEITALAGSGIPGFMSIPAHQLQTLLHAPLMPLFLLAGIAMIGGLTAMLVAGCLIFLALVIQFVTQYVLRRMDARRHSRDLAVTQSTQEFIDHLELLRTSVGPQAATERVEHHWRRQESAMRQTQLGAALATLASTLAGALPLIAYTAYLVLIAEHTAPALLLAQLLLIARAAAPLEALALAGIGINDLSASLRDFGRVLSAPALPMPAPGEARQPENNDLVVDTIRHPPALHDLSVQIPEGSRLLVTGPSGSGKSTLLEFLMRFDDPENGSITLGGAPLNAMPYQEIVRRIAYVGQEPMIFTGTLADNVRIGWPQAPEAEVERALRLAALGPVIDRSPLGIDQPVGRQGAALSGGERQRLAIARALIKQAPILVLDEATSALDDKTEQQIARVLAELPATIVLVTHRDVAIWKPSEILDLDH